MKEKKNFKKKLDSKIDTSASETIFFIFSLIPDCPFLIPN